MPDRTTRPAGLLDSVPEAVELGQNTGWELWTQAVASQEAVEQGAALEPMLAEVRRNNRVCPQQGRWVEMYKLLLQHAARTEAGLPPRVLAGAAWSTSSAIDKRVCLRQQLEWADAHGCLGRVAAFLRALPESDWHRLDAQASAA